MTRHPQTSAGADRHAPRPRPRRPAQPPSPQSAQGGAVLITGLIFLTLLTILGTTSVMNNVLQERMASNTRNRDLAFQAAEHALDDAHTWLKTEDKASMQTYVNAAGTDLVADDGIRTGGETHANDAAYWQDFDWTSNDLCSDSNNLCNVPTIGEDDEDEDRNLFYAQPRYVAERLPPATDCDPATAGNQPCDLYRVTARGVGATADAVVILQTLYQVK